MCSDSEVDIDTKVFCVYSWLSGTVIFNLIPL